METEDFFGSVPSYDKDESSRDGRKAPIQGITSTEVIGNKMAQSAGCKMPMTNLRSTDVRLKQASVACMHTLGVFIIHICKQGKKI